MRKIIHNTAAIILAFMLIRLVLKLVIQIDIMYQVVILDDYSVVYGLDDYVTIWNILNISFTALYVLIEFTKTEKRK